jgi:hypothetical protein
MHIDSITPGVIDGHDVKMIWLRGGTGFGQNGTELIYDRFGPQHGFFYYECWGVLDCTPLHLCKYVSNETGEVHIEGSYCDNLPTAISDLSVADWNVHLFPNPTTNLVNITLGESISIPVDIEVYTTSGSLVHSEHMRSPGIQINLTNMAPGMYLCRVISGPRTWVRLFVHQ